MITEEYIKRAQDLNPDLCPEIVRKLLLDISSREMLACDLVSGIGGLSAKEAREMAYGIL